MSELACKGAVDLSEVSEVVRDPGREELAKGDEAEFRVAADKRQLGTGELPASNRGDVVATQRAKAVKKLGKGPAREPSELSETIERLEGTGLSMLENDASTGNPVSLFAVNEVADDIDRAPGVGPFIGCMP